MDNKVILVGGFYEIIEFCEDNDIEIVGIIDNYFINDIYWGYLIIGMDDKVKVLFEIYKNVLVLIILDVFYVCYKLYYYYKSIGFQVVLLISWDVFIFCSVIIGEGIIIQRGVNFFLNIKIGQMVKVNMNVNIMYDCLIGNYVIVVFNVVLLGKVEIDDKVYIGVNVILLFLVKIGENVIVGVGFVVIKLVCFNIVVKGSFVK